MSPPADTLLKILTEPRAANDLGRYFALSLAGSSPRFTGGRFERLAGGGDRPSVRNRVAAEDLLAVTMLSVHVPAAIALELLEGSLGEDVAAHLAQIPTDVDLGSDRAHDLVAPRAPAELMWELLKDCDGVGWVTAGKLLARKRPRLIPVYDHVVRCVYGRPRHFWLWLHGLLADEDIGLRASLQDLRMRAGVPEDISDLRILDVAVWMRHRADHVASRCRGANLA